LVNSKESTVQPFTAKLFYQFLLLFIKCYF